MLALSFCPVLVHVMLAPMRMSLASESVVTSSRVSPLMRMDDDLPPSGIVSTRRNALLLLAPSLLLGAAPSAHADDASTIAYADVVQQLDNCRLGYECNLSKIAFTSNTGETGDALYTTGERRPIIGIPNEVRRRTQFARCALRCLLRPRSRAFDSRSALSLDDQSMSCAHSAHKHTLHSACVPPRAPQDPNSDSSPYKLVAKARDAKIPYSFPFSDLSKYKKK